MSLNDIIQKVKTYRLHEQNQRYHISVNLDNLKQEHRKCAANLTASNVEKIKLTKQLNEANEKIRKLKVAARKSNFDHQGEIAKLNEILNQERKAQKKNLAEMCQCTELLKKEFVTVSKKFTEKEIKLRLFQQRLLKLQKKNETLNKQVLQIQLQNSSSDYEPLRNSSSRCNELENQIKTNDNEIISLNNHHGQDTNFFINLKESKGGKDMEKMTQQLEIIREKLDLTQQQFDCHKQTPDSSKKATCRAITDKLGVVSTKQIPDSSKKATCRVITDKLGVVSPTVNMSSSFGISNKLVFPKGPRLSKADDLIAKAIAMACESEEKQPDNSKMNNNQKRPLESLSEVNFNEKHMRKSAIDFF